MSELHSLRAAQNLYQIRFIRIDDIFYPPASSPFAQVELDNLWSLIVAERDCDDRFFIIAGRGADLKIADQKILRVEQRIEVQRPDFVGFVRQYLPQQVCKLAIEELLQLGFAFACEDRPATLVVNFVEIPDESRRSVCRLRNNADRATEQNKS